MTNKSGGEANVLKDARLNTDIIVINDIVCLGMIKAWRKSMKKPKIPLRLPRRSGLSGEALQSWAAQKARRVRRLGGRGPGPDVHLPAKILHCSFIQVFSLENTHNNS